MCTGDDGKVESYDESEQNTITITAPEPADGYEFKYWKPIQTNSENNVKWAKDKCYEKTITFTWKDMDSMYEAVYEPIKK